MIAGALLLQAVAEVLGPFPRVQRIGPCLQTQESGAQLAFLTENARTQRDIHTCTHTVIT